MAIGVRRPRKTATSNKGTLLCQAAGKRVGHYLSSADTKAVCGEIKRSAGIPADPIFTVTNGPNHLRGTWVHPDLEIHLGSWLSPKFSVFVSRLVQQWKAAQAPNPFEDPETAARLYLEAKEGERKLLAENRQLLKDYKTQGMLLSDLHESVMVFSGRADEAARVFVAKTAELETKAAEAAAQAAAIGEMEARIERLNREIANELGAKSDGLVPISLFASRTYKEFGMTRGEPTRY